MLPSDPYDIVLSREEWKALIDLTMHSWRDIPEYEALTLEERLYIDKPTFDQLKATFKKIKAIKAGLPPEIGTT